MFESLPEKADSFRVWTWEDIEPFYERLTKRPLTTDTVHEWLSEWSQLSNLISETYARLRLKTTLDTTDSMAEISLTNFLNQIYTPSQRWDQQLKTKLLDSGLTPDGMALPLRKMRTDAALYTEDNLDLFTQEVKLGSKYNRIIGTQTVTWDGETRTVTQLQPYYQTPDRAQREEIWQLIADRRLRDRDALNELWQEMLLLRQKIAYNAGFETYLAYKWSALKRFDYTPDDSRRFHEAIAEVVVPAVQRSFDQVQAELGVETLRPWDLMADAYGLSFPALRPFSDVAALEAGTANMFRQVDPALGEYFEVMRAEQLLDMANQPGKAPGAYCTYFATEKRPFIFMNAVGTAEDIRTMLHEAGHAFHTFESRQLPYHQQRHPGHEFSEVASMAMELLASPYLGGESGGFYDDPTEQARHRINHLRKIMAFWPYMAVVDSFQHWVYENINAAMDPANCDAKWGELWQRFVPYGDWTGFETVRDTGWHRKQHIFRAPFYYIEYGMAQVGAIQVWRNALGDRPKAIEQYRQALSLGGTQSLPELYEAAGATFRFDETTMQAVISLLEGTINELAA